MSIQSTRITLLLAALILAACNSDSSDSSGGGSGSSGDDTAPTLKPAESEDGLIISADGKILTVSFNENVKAKDGADLKALITVRRVTGVKSGDGTYPTTKVDYTTADKVRIVAGKVQITLATALQDGRHYLVKVGANALTDLAGNAFAGGDTEEDGLEILPTLKTGDDALAINTAAKTFTVSFSKTIKKKDGVTADLNTRIKVYKVVGNQDDSVNSETDDTEVVPTGGNLYTVAIVDGRVVVTFKGALPASGKYYVKIAANTLTDSNDYPLAESTTEADSIS